MTWTIEERAWDDPAGAALRAAQRAELDARYGCEDHEPGAPPSAADIDLFLVAVDPDGDALGCGALRRLDPASAEVKRMYVTPAARGSGVATALLRALEAAAVHRGWTTVRLETGTAQPEAVRFYEREGYRSIPLFGAYQGSTLSLCYERNLEKETDQRTSGLTLRTAVAADLPELKQVYREASLSNAGDAPLLLAQPEYLEFAGDGIAAGQTLVAVDDGRVVGFGTVVPGQDDGPELEDLFVHPDWMRRGIARDLVRQLAVVARDEGHQRLWVTGNPHARAFYRAAGFLDVGQVGTELGSGFRMYLDLRRP